MTLEEIEIAIDETEAKIDEVLTRISVIASSDALPYTSDGDSVDPAKMLQSLNATLKSLEEHLSYLKRLYILESGTYYVKNRILT